MTAALGPWILRHPDVASGMEQFVLQFVGPEFASPEGYMRAIVSFFILFFLTCFHLCGTPCGIEEPALTRFRPARCSAQ